MGWLESLFSEEVLSALFFLCVWLKIEQLERKYERRFHRNEKEEHFSKNYSGNGRG